MRLMIIYQKKGTRPSCNQRNLSHNSPLSNPNIASRPTYNITILSPLQRHQTHQAIIANPTAAAIAATANPVADLLSARDGKMVPLPTNDG